ncbi:MAG TPA: hypothetical protein VG815_08155, partial [Chloroflexota bacterium]|nr:hypothetical protein [Chloroflexota bacterium]
MYGRAFRSHFFAGDLVWGAAEPLAGPAAIAPSHRPPRKTANSSACVEQWRDRGKLSRGELAGCGRLGMISLI